MILSENSTIYTGTTHYNPTTTTVVLWQDTGMVDTLVRVLVLRATESDFPCLGTGGITWGRAGRVWGGSFPKMG